MNTTNFNKAAADRTMYIFDIEPHGVHVAARITITECGADGFHVRLETIARTYTHHGFVASPNDDKHASSWSTASDIAAKFAIAYEKEHEASLPKKSAARRG